MGNNAEMGNKMKIVLLTDTHGDTQNIEKMKDDISSSDVVIVVGDITHFGGHDEAAKVIDAIRKYQPNVYGVSGNCDYHDIDAYLDVEQINIHGKVVRLAKDLYIAGLGGSQTTPFDTPNEYQEKDYIRILDELGQKVESRNSRVILAAHNPPYGTACDKVRSGANVGSRPVRQFIEKHSPLICLCGHIHESAAKDMIADTMVINPGPAKDGHYGLIEITEKGIKAEIKKASAAKKRFRFF